MSDRAQLLTIPNVSEGRDQNTIMAISDAFTCAGETRLLDVHSDADHHRSVYTLAGYTEGLTDRLLAGARVAVEKIDIRDGRGVHPHVGALDVVPIVYLTAEARGSACALALLVADRIAVELDIPVFTYGELAQGRTRATLRKGGIKGLEQRIATGELRAAFGPSTLHPSAGATLIAAREPLVAFNVLLAPPADLSEAKRIAGLIRETGEHGLPGVRALGLLLDEDAAQISMNIERPLEVPLAEVVNAVRQEAQIASAELVGLAPHRAMENFPTDIPMPGFDPSRHLLENALGF